MIGQLKNLLSEDTLDFYWVEHGTDLKLGPFQFPPGLPIPVAGNLNELAHMTWLSVPYKTRKPVASDFEINPDGLDGETLLKEFIDGKITIRENDLNTLIDQVGRSLLMIAALDRDNKYFNEIKAVIENVESGSALFDILVRIGKSNVDIGLRYSDNGQPEEALKHLMIAFALQNGAHLISPSTYGVLYNLGILCNDIANRFSLPDQQDDEKWKKIFCFESAYFIQLALADEDIRNNTPGLYLLGMCREVLGENEGAQSAYKMFLKSSQLDKYQDIVKDIEIRLDKLNKKK